MDATLANIVKQQTNSLSTAAKTPNKVERPAVPTSGSSSGVKSATVKIAEKYDTLELSQDYLDYIKNQTIDKSVNQLSTASKEAPVFSAVVNESKKNKVATTVTVNSKANLRALDAYSFEELRELYTNGNISLSQYQAEIAKRQMK